MVFEIKRYTKSQRVSKGSKPKFDTVLKVLNSLAIKLKAVA